ncbi:MAG: dephospho-CoA kinase [Thermoleophilia bacterium]
MEKTGKISAPLVALTGGIGAGKSAALAVFAELGAAVLDCDRVVHRLLQRDDVRAAVAAALGLEALPAGDDGRRALADLVFSDDARLERLEAILHPLVRREIEDWRRLDATAAASLAVVEIQLLFEAGMDDMFDARVLVTAPLNTRRARLEDRLDAADFDRRSARQMSDREKGGRCEYRFDNGGAPGELADFVRGVYCELARESGD